MFGRLAVFFVKVLWQGVTLFVAMAVQPRPSHVLLQNPPSLPAIAVCWAISLLRGCTFVIDWHNYGYTILALGVGARHPLVAVHRWYERAFGRLSTANLCVTRAMSEDLASGWGIRAAVMYDRPPDVFRSIDLLEKHELLTRLGIFNSECEGCTDEATLFTRMTANGEVRCNSDRPAFLVSSTSWTEDEDFSLLLTALDIYDKKSSAEENLPPLVCVITGKGPLKEHYAGLVARRRWSRVTVHMPWLEPDDYPRLLACADVGVCLHQSSSGLDLPMKVVDMFGCGLPVCAVQFRCIDELVKHDVNGKTFRTDAELAEQLENLLRGFPDGCELLRTFRGSLKSFQEVRWDQAWSETVLPIFT